MRKLSRTLSTIALSAALFAPVLIAGCSAHAGYRSYDSYHNDYHTWNDGEVVYYSNWEHETHRDHRDFKKRSADEQKDYWKWRHDHDNDRH
jgi:hypothetical protein